MTGVAGLAPPNATKPGPGGEELAPLPPQYRSARQAIKAWRALGASRWVIKNLLHGAQIPWRGGRRPPRHRARPFKLAADDEDFARTEMEKNLRAGFWVELNEQEIEQAEVVVNGFVTRSAGSKRFVIDARYQNDYIDDRRFKYESLMDLAPQLRPDDSLIGWDVRGAYHHVALRPDDQRFFCFQCLGRTFRCTTMPFGLKVAPFIWTKVCRPVVGKLREMGFRVIVYVDDFGGAPPTRSKHGPATGAEAVRGSQAVRQLFYDLGLHVHPDKGCYAGTRRLPLLGFIIDTERQLFLVKPERAKQVMGMAARLVRHAARHRRWVPHGLLRSFAGTAVSTSLAVPAARFRLRSVYTAMAEHTKAKRTRLGKQAISDIKWWAALTTNAYNGRALWPAPPSATIHTDASSTGWGATWDEVVPARGFHEVGRKDLHINLLELGAVRLGLLSFVNFLKQPETIVRLVTDSRVVMHVVNNGSSRSAAVMRELRRLRDVCEALGVQLRAEYLPSALNLYADSLSRATDSTDWSLRDATFRRLDAVYGPHTVDLCATAENTKCARFFSKQASPGSAGVDALLQDWRRENGWCNPPFNMLLPVVRKVIQQEASVTLVAPVWRAQAWWHLAARHCSHYQLLSEADGVSTHGTRARAAKTPTWRVAVFRFDGHGPATRCPA